MRSFFVLLGIMFVLQGCYYDKADKLYGVSSSTCDTTNLTYNNSILPILSQNCISGCHDASTQAGGYDYSTYAAIIATNNIQNGKLLGAINHLQGYYAMPQTGGKLSACNINKITAWVNTGYPEK